MVPDSCCKTVVTGCGKRDHASNIYKVEVGGCLQEVGLGQTGLQAAWSTILSH